MTCNCEHCKRTRRLSDIKSRRDPAELVQAVEELQDALCNTEEELSMVRYSLNQLRDDYKTS